MTILRFRASESPLSAALLSRLRQITPLSISEIRSRASAGEPLLEISAFTNTWREDRRKLVTITNEIQAGLLPLTVTEVHGSKESPVSINMLRNLIAHFRQIELDTQRDTMLEMGEIDDPSQFTPHDEDWTK